MNLVEIKRNEVYCDSHTVSKKFEQKLGRIKKLINNVIEDLGVHECTPYFNPKYIIEEREYRGNKYTAYLMNRDFFSLLVMRFKGAKAVKWQIQFIAAFNAMEEKLIAEHKNSKDAAWITVRGSGKIARKEETDVIKGFIEYATNQGSKNAKFYYKHVTNVTYKALDLMFQKKPKLRDTLNIYEISELLLAERVAKESLQKYMYLGRNYKDIYESVKDDLLSFGNQLRLGQNKISTITHNGE